MYNIVDTQILHANAHNNNWLNIPFKTRVRDSNSVFSEVKLMWKWKVWKNRTDIQAFHLNLLLPLCPLLSLYYSWGVEREREMDGEKDSLSLSFFPSLTPFVSNCLLRVFFIWHLSSSLLHLTRLRLIFFDLANVPHTHTLVLLSLWGHSLT